MSNNSNNQRKSQLIPFYGAKYPEIFEIERRCMDRQGKVIDHLAKTLPSGIVLDIGAGNGFTASRLTASDRRVVPMEPDAGMIDPNQSLLWTQGLAQAIPFKDQKFDAVYATWAFFFVGIPDLLTGLHEAIRVIKDDGWLIMVDNAGEDEFCQLSSHNIASDRNWWKAHGFQETILETQYQFDSVTEAKKLITFYFGEAAGAKIVKSEIEYKVVVYSLQIDKNTRHFRIA